MKAYRLTAIALAMVGLGFAQTGNAADMGDTVMIGCTMPGPEGAIVYSIDNKDPGDNAISLPAGVQTGRSCSRVLNAFLPALVPGSTSTIQPNCAPNSSAENTGIWQQSAAYPSGDLVGGAVPTLLQIADSNYALQQFTFTCVSPVTGGLEP